MFRRLLSGAALALGLLHAWIFVRQAAAGSLTPETLLKWIAAAGLLAALVALRRQGVSLFRGRRAVAVWVLAALLHAPAIGERLTALETPALPEAAIALSQALASAASLAGVLLLLWIARQRPSASSRVRLAARAIVPSAVQAARATFAFAPRPPPSV
ncbi:MAG TPA: hypothetical protein VFZ36_05225 [Vicinamibacterales bacterium]